MGHQLSENFRTLDRNSALRTWQRDTARRLVRLAVDLEGSAGLPQAACDVLPNGNTGSSTSQLTAALDERDRMES
eukprot:10007766-Alexandrium_andersonii.AAC.1